ncbi:PREDICTED: uncharacterized protein MAL13P1.304-like, partial [Wasmannia auropunctata]|uniref:uncharacterized protein MAL13P1.304-like n=1 Tax=Wasmannia auropunctata TaxID=64793 RepID=UPI0005EFBD6F
DLDGVSLNSDNISIHYDNIITEKDEIYKIISRAGKKPLWIAESKPQKSKHQYLEALIFTRRLGDAAKLGIQVVMRQLSDLSQATPIYWVSLLYKTLVGREVLDMKLQSNNESYVHFYSHCTKPSALYSKGAITIFGINLTPRKVTVSLKNLKIQILHKYILLPDFETGNKMFSEKVLLNDEPLNLINDKKLPDINPEIIINSEGLELELLSGGIGFWIIPNAKVKACTCSAEETIETMENNIAKKLSKRHENNIQQDNQEEKEKNMNQLNVTDDVEENIRRLNLKKLKIYGKQDNKKQENVKNTRNESQHKVWSSKLLARIKRILQKKLQTMNKNKSSNLQRSFIIDLGDENFEDVEEQQNLKNFEKTEIHDKFESIRNTLKKYKYILLEKKTEMKTKDIQHLESEIDNVVTLISKLDALLLHKITSNESIMNKIKDKTKNVEESIIKIDKKLKEYLTELENSDEIKANNIIKTIGKCFNKLYNLLEDNDLIKNRKNDQVSIYKDLIKGKRFKRHLGRKSKNSKKIRILKKRSRIDDLKNYIIKKKTKRKNDDKKKPILSNNFFDKKLFSKKNFINNKKKYNNLLQQNLVKKFFKLDAFKNADNHIGYPHLTQEHNRIENDNIYRKHSKISDMENNMQQLVNYYDDSKKQEYDSNSFAVPSQVSTVAYNYNDYQISSVNYDKLKEKNGFIKDIDNKDINAKVTQYSIPNTYAKHSIYNKIFHNKRNKRSNSQKLQKIFAEEMIKEDEENAKDCHCRIIRVSNSPRKLYYHRVKRNVSVPITRFTDISSENKNVNTDVVQSKENSTIREEYEEIMTGEILPSTNVIESDSEENSTTTESVITELSTVDPKLNDTTQTIDVISISGVDNVSEQYRNTKKSTTNLLPVNSDSEFFLNNNNNNIKYVTKKTFFRTQSSDIQSDNKTKTYDSPQVISKIPTENKNIREELIVSVTENAQETAYEKIQDLINKNEKTDSSIYSTIAEDQKNEKGYNSDYKIGFKSTNSLKETTKGIDEQVTTETILLKRAASITINNSKSNESKTKSKLRDTEDNQNNESEIRKQLGKRTNTRRLKTTLQSNLPRASLDSSYLSKNEEHLTRRTEQIDKLIEKLNAKRKKLLNQYQNDLTKITDEQKKNLKKREAWDRLRESDFQQLLDRKFIEILLDDDVTDEDGNVENYLNLIELVPKQYKNVIDKIYLLAKAKKIHYPDNKYYQFLRNLIEDNEKLTETSKSSEHKYNQHYKYIPKSIEDKQESIDERETASRSFNRKVFIFDPSTYYGGEPILQLYEDYLKLPKYQIENPTPRWILKNIHQISKSQEYVEKLPIKNCDQENTNILYVLDTQKQYNLSKKLTALAQAWLNSLNRKDVNHNKVVSNEEANDLNNMHKNPQTDKDNLDSMSINEKTEFIRGFGTKSNIENKKFTNSNNKKKDIINSEKTEDAGEVVKTKKSENIELTKQKEINKSYNPNDKVENNLNNHNKIVEHIRKIIEDDPKGKELGKENIRSRRDVEQQTDKLIKDIKNKFNRMKVREGMKEKYIQEIFDKPMMIFPLNDKLLNADMFERLKNYLLSLKRNFEVNQQTVKERELNYIALVPIKIRNIYEMLNAKNNNDSLEHLEIPAQWDNQYVLGEMSDSMNKYLDDDKASEEFEYEDLSNLQSANSESILDKESCSCENKQDIFVKDSEVESEEDEQYRITNDEIDTYLKMKNQVESNKRKILLLLPWRSVNRRQQRQIKSEDIAEIKREITRQSQPNESILAKDLKNKRTKRYYLNNNIDKEEENMMATNDIRINYLPQTNRKNYDNLLEGFIETRKKNNLYNNKASSVRNEEKKEIISLNNISKSDKKLLQKEIPRLQNHMESVEEFVNNPEKNFNDTLASNEDKHHRNKTFGTIGNVFHTAIINIKDFLALFSNIPRIFMQKF